jgi:tRNA(fMet)-specific endonuclease VapC
VTFLLDTNTCIYAMKGDAIVLRAMARVSPDEVAISSISVAELWFGARKSTNPRRSRAAQDAFLEPLHVLDFDKQAAEEYATIREHLERRGAPTGERDQMIASIARAHHRTLVTNNLREFGRVPRLRVTDWMRPDSA